MSESPDKAEVVRLLDEKVKRLAAIAADLLGLDSEHEEELAALTAEYARRVDPLTAEQTQLMNEVAELFSQHRLMLLPGKLKTLVLRSGRLSARRAKSVEVTDEAKAIAFLRRRGWLHRFATRAAWKTSKTLLSKDLDLAAKIPGVEVREVERLTLTLARPLKQQVRDLFPHRREIS